MRFLKKLTYLICLFIFLTFVLGPIFWMLLISLSPKSEMLAPSLNFIPSKITLDAYRDLFSFGSRSQSYFKGLINSMKAVAFSLSLGIPIAYLTAFTLTKMSFKGRTLMKNMLLITMVIPVMATIIPIYRIFSLGHLLDKIFWLSLVYVSAYLPMATWMMCNYLSTIPKEIEEAGRMDGCHQKDLMFKIFLPLSYPMILSVTLMIFLSTWSQFQIPLILASSKATKPMAIVISEFVSKDSIDYSLITASGMISILPPALMAFIFRKYFLDGMMKGATKG